MRENASEKFEAEEGEIPPGRLSKGSKGFPSSWANAKPLRNRCLPAPPPRRPKWGFMDNGLAQGCPASLDMNILFEPFHRWAAAQKKGVAFADLRRIAQLC